MVTDPAEPADRLAPSRRLVLLGASNIQRTFARLVASAQDALGAPLDVLTAMGHGRSYGRRSQVLARALPGILECPLWAALDESAERETFALVTDVGNDLGFGFEVMTILSWVEECLSRLEQRRAKIIVTALPLFNLTSISPARYQFFRRLFFPGNRCSLEEMRGRAQRLDEGLRRLATRGRHTLVEPLPPWYGLDPIHIRLSGATEIWSEVLAPWRVCASLDGGARAGEATRVDQGEPSATRVPFSRRWRYRWLRPHTRWMWNRPQHAAQPTLVEANGTRLSLY